MKYPCSDIERIIFMLVCVLACLGFLFPGLFMRFIFEPGYPFFIRLICAFVLLLGVLFAIIILVGILKPLLRKKSKGDNGDMED